MISVGFLRISIYIQDEAKMEERERKLFLKAMMLPDEGFCRTVEYLKHA